MNDIEYGFDASSGSEYANVARPEKAKESEAEWRLHQQQHGWGFGGGNGRGFGRGNGRGLGRGNGRGLGLGNGRGLGRSERGGYGEQMGHVRGGGPKSGPMVPSHFQMLMLGEKKKGRCWGILGSPPQGQVPVQDSSAAEYRTPPPAPTAAAAAATTRGVLRA